MAEKAVKRRIPDTVSIPFVLNQMQIGKTRYRDINYGTRVIAVQNVDMEKVGRNMTESSGEEVEISQDGKKDAIYKPAPLNCHSGLKVSVIPPTCEQVTGAMFIDSNFVLLGGGVTSNELYVVDVKEVRRANSKFKETARDGSVKPDSLKMAPDIGRSVERVSRILPKTNNSWWTRGTKGLKMNRPEDLIICSAANGCNLAILKIQQNEHWGEGLHMANEAKNKDGIIKNPKEENKNPNQFNDDEKYALQSKAGTLMRWGVGMAHSRPIAGFAWLADYIAITAGEDGLVALWDVRKNNPKEIQDQWPTGMVQITERGVGRISNRLHQRKMIAVNSFIKNRRFELVGVNEIAGTGKIVSCAAGGSVHIMDGVTATHAEKRCLPQEQLPIKMSPNTKIFVAQDVSNEIREVVAATNYKLMMVDDRKPDYTQIVNICENELMPRHGRITAVNAKDELYSIGHVSGAISFLDRRTNKILGDEGDDRRQRKIWNLGPSWLSVTDGRLDQDEPFDYYPVRTMCTRGHRLLAGGGPISCNGLTWAVAMMSLFE